MSKIVGIVAEFSPFHNGHAALTQMARADGAEAIIAVMSGNFTQRGTPAIADKRIRANAALLSGVDLIIELPLFYSLSPAPRFAQGAIELLAATGCVDTLVFGSETADISQLRNLAQILDNPHLAAAMQPFLSSGLGAAAARQSAVEILSDKTTAALLSMPNNILGVEYIRAANAIGWNPQILSYPRLGAGHDCQIPTETFASAGFLRENAQNFHILCQFVPKPAFQVYQNAADSGIYPADSTRLDTAILSHLRRLTPLQLALLPDISEGLENRIYHAVRTAKSLSELENLVKTRRYTLSRIRRIILSAFLGITAQDVQISPPYLRILGFNQNGAHLLSIMKKKARLPFSHSLARLRDLPGDCQKFALAEAFATDMYALSLLNSFPSGFDYSAKPIFLKAH